MAVKMNLYANSYKYALVFPLYRQTTQIKSQCGNRELQSKHIGRTKFSRRITFLTHHSPQHELNHVFRMILRNFVSIRIVLKSRY